MLYKNILKALLVGMGISTSQDYPNFEIIHNQNPYQKPIILHTMSNQNRYMAIIDSNLNVQWHINSGNLGLDFKVNQTYLTYFDRLNKSWILMNEFMKEIDTMICVNSQSADYHDFQILNNGNYILQAYDSLFVNMSTIVEGGQPVAWITGIVVIQEFNSDDELVFEWNAWDNLDISNYTNLNLEADIINWMHVNSIEVDFDDNLLVSNRRSNEIIKINRTNGNVIWHLGGPLNDFSIINDPKNGFKMQHDARRINNGNITIFDNGVTHSPPISRAIEYEINEENFTANLVWEYIHPDSILGLAMGSVQRLPNGNTLINWGTISNQGALISEVDSANNLVLEIRYPLFHRAYKVRKNNWAFEVNLICGDTNLDSRIDIYDLQYIADYIYNVNNIHNIYHLFRADANKDGQIDILDIEVLISTILL